MMRAQKTQDVVAGSPDAGVMGQMMRQQTDRPISPDVAESAVAQLSHQLLSDHAVTLGRPCLPIDQINMDVDAITAAQVGNGDGQTDVELRPQSEELLLERCGHQRHAEEAHAGKSADRKSV